MASPTVRSTTYSSLRRGIVLQRVPLQLRRCGAWIVEVSLVAASAWVPFQAGLHVNSQFKGEPVPLNSVLANVENAIARTLALSPSTQIREIAPLTNLLWSGTLLFPFVMAGSQLHLLAKTGRTLPKRWFGVEVVTESGTSPGLARVLVREAIGRWVPLGAAYFVWRYSGAFPGLGILAALTGLVLLGGGLLARMNRQHRALHDLLSGTYVLDAALGQVESPLFLHGSSDLLSEHQNWAGEDGAIAAIILAPDLPQSKQRFWHWLRHRPGTALLTFLLLALFLALGTFAGVQIYIQKQTNWREAQQQKDQVFLALIDQLTTSVDAKERLTAVLALATLDDPRVTPLLVDLLTQETDPALINALHQALVSLGTKTLPHLQKLNQSLQTEIASLRQSGNRQERNTAVKRLRVTQQAIAKILSIYSGQVSGFDLSRVDLGQAVAPLAPFTLVLDQVDLSGITLRGATLTGASFRGSRLYNLGEDDRSDTYDDWIADLSGADLKAADLTGALLNHVLLQRTNLTGTILNKADLSFAQLNQANLSNTSFIEADLHQADLRDASITGANLGNANLSQANLQGALLGQVQAVGARLPSANLSRSDWRGSNLSRADLSRSNLREADLGSTQLTNANLRDAQMQNANLREANLSSADLRGANLSGADFQGAIFVPPPATAVDQFIKTEPAFVENDFLREVDFSAVRNLSPQQIDYICFQDGVHPECQ